MLKRDSDSLLNRGKHYVCQYITEYCYEQSVEKSLDGTNLVDKHLSLHDHRRVNRLVDHLFDYRNSCSPEELTEWIKHLICGRRLPNSFAKEVKQHDTASKCGLVWTTNFVAYRCRTCAISLCMSLCANCFLNGNHEGHDFNMFRSQAGGACDCGDSFVMKSDGFCCDHQPKTESIKKIIPPNSLLCIAKEITPHLLYYLVLYLRENNFESNKKVNALLSDILIYLNDLGTLMQSIICDALTDSELYSSSLRTVNREDDLEYQHRLLTLTDNYKKAVQEIQLSTILPSVDPSLIYNLDIVNEIESFRPELVHKTFLDEIIFWTVINEFPSNLITFLLKMLPDEEYKIRFAESFVKHYFRISLLILHPTERFMKSLDRDIYHNKLANAVVHVSVQLFSNQNLALLLCDRSKLLYIIIISLKYAIEGNRDNFSGILMPNLSMRNKNVKTCATSLNQFKVIHQVVQCDHQILRWHRYWPIVSDLNNLFTHKSIAFIFLQDKVLVDLWLEFIMSFQAMNLNTKQSLPDNENGNYKSSYLAELEICASQMWTLISHLTEESSKSMTINFVHQSQQWLETWLQLIAFEMSCIDVNTCTFHLPLHRYYSVFMQHAITVQNVPADSLLPSGDVEKLKCLIAHPLQTVVSFYHIMAGLWVNNGLQIKTQAFNYMQPHFCNSTIDADMFLIQQAATRILPDIFIDMFATVYNLKQHLYIIPFVGSEIDSDKLIIFLENAFTFLATIVGQQINLGMSSAEVTRKEMVTLLSVSDKTHSQIHDMLPYKCGFLQNSFIDILNDIAEYKSPEVEVSGSLVQGYFYPKNKVWEHEYDPLFTLYRNALRRDFQTSLQRFAAYGKQSGKYTSSSLPWPPFRIPPTISNRFIDPRFILNSKLLHAYFFSILLKGINDSTNVTQHLLSVVVYLIELTLIESSKREDLPLLNLDEPKIVNFIVESKFETWYPSDDILENFFITFKKIQTHELSRNINTKFLVGLFNSLIHDEYSIFRDLDDDFTGESPTIIVANDDDDEEPDEININGSDYYSEDSNHAIEDNCTFVPAHEDDDENVTYTDIANAKAAIMAALNIDSASNEDSITEEDSSAVASSSSTLPDGNRKAHSGRLKSPLSKTKPLAIECSLDESILSLLLKLHSKLSGKRDSFKTDSKHLDTYDLHSRIGDGPYFIGCLLKRFILLCAKRLELQKQNELIDQSDNIFCTEICLAKVISVVDEIRGKIWPKSISNLSEPSSSKCNQTISSTDNIMTEDIKMESDIDMEEVERQEKKRRALERKQQIMNQFRSLQNKFIQNNKDNLDEVDQETSSMEKPSQQDDVVCDPMQTSDLYSESADNIQVKYQPKTYHCVICGDTGFSTLERSFVQVVLLQSTSILGNALAHTLHDDLCFNLASDKHGSHQASSSSSSASSSSSTLKSNRIPITDEEHCRLSERKTFADYFEKRVDTSCAAFALDSWLSSFNIGWCGGVHAQSCGHFMHMDCYQSYIVSVYQNREMTDLIEYSCPLCRKTANSVLPIIPNFANLYALVKSRNNDPHGVAFEILELLSNGDKGRLANTTENESKFLKVLANAIEDVMKATEPQFRNIRVDPCPQSLFLFLSSISRTNLEYGILLWRSNLLQTNSKVSCFVPLFQALSLNAKLVLPMHFTQLWSKITGINCCNNESPVIPYEKQVPLLFKDVSAILLQILYALPFNIDKAYFISIVQALLNLNFIQAIVIVLYQMSHEQRVEFKSKYAKSDHQSANYSYYIGFILNNYELNQCFFGVLNSFRTRLVMSEEIILSLIAKICLPFLRASSMMFNLLYHQPELPACQFDENVGVLQEFSTLANYLNLNSGQSPLKIIGPEFYNPFINWISNDHSALVTTWYTEFDKFVQSNTMAARNLLKESFILTQKPSLLSLPPIYEQLFMYYHKKTCNICNNVPKDPSICLICGQLVCIRESCCRTGSTLEGVTHAKKCGAGTAIYITINSSTIIVIRGRKACIWGSVYLDEYGEEDRDLKRGRPLFLCKERYRILEQQWLTHSFLYTNKKWIYHKDSL